MVPTESHDCVPQSTVPPLDQIVQCADGNDGAHSVPEISGVHIAVDLEDSIVKDLTQKVGGLIRIGEVDARSVERHGH